MNEQCFLTIDAFLATLANLHRASSDRGTQLWFRGQEDASWPLDSKLHREASKLLKSAGLELSFGGSSFNLYTRELERLTYQEFRRRALTMLSEDQRRPWATLFLMRHYGLPTRLLDWSESLGVALTFARRTRATTPPAVFVMDPGLFNHNNHGSYAVRNPEHDERLQEFHPFANPNLQAPWPLSIAVSSEHTNERVGRQRGTFVIVGSESAALDVAYPQFISKLVLAPSALPALDHFLDMMGMGEAALYGDLEHLAGEIGATMRQRLERQIVACRARYDGGERIPEDARAVDVAFGMYIAAQEELEKSVATR